MELKIENGRKILIAKDGCVIQSVTDGSILGKKLILGKKDSEIHLISESFSCYSGFMCSEISTCSASPHRRSRS